MRPRRPPCTSRPARVLGIHVSPGGECAGLHGKSVAQQLDPAFPLLRQSERRLRAATCACMVGVRRQTGVRQETAAMPAKPFCVTTTDCRTLRLAGELDMASVSKLQAELELRPHGTSTAFDLTELTFLDSSGLNAFSQHAKTLNGEGPLVLENVPDSIADLLRLVGFDQLSTIDIRR